MAEFNILANLQYSRIQHNRTDLSGVTPTIFANTGSTSGYTEADALVLNQFASTDLLDTELFFNTNDKRIFARLDDTIVELVTSGGTLSDRFTTGATLNGNIISFNRNDTLSAYTIDLSSIIPTGYWTAGTGTNSAVLGGSNSVASGILSVAEGSGTTASGNYSHSEGHQTTASGDFSHAEGYYTTATALYSHAEGYFNISTALGSHAEGVGNQATAQGAHAEGQATIASGQYSHAEGYTTTAAGNRSHAEGETNYASGQASHVEGGSNIASGAYSHAEGALTTASNNYSHSEGLFSIANGSASHAEGGYTTASGNYSHAEGIYTTAVGSGSHAEGYKNTSNSTYTHTGGQYNIASGTNSFIHSSGSTVYGDDSTILGGSGNVINAFVTGSTILGGSYITGTTSDTVYGVNFNASGNIIGGTISATTYSNLPTTGVLTYMFISGASSISSYQQAVPLNRYVTSGISISSTTVTTTPTILGVFATNIGQPNLTLIPSGGVTVHYDVQKQSGPINYYTYVELYKRTSGGTETLLTTSDSSSQSALNSIQNITVTASLANNTLLDLTDRIITKIYAVMASSNAVIDLRIDDGTNARIELPYAVGSMFDIYTTGATLNSTTLQFRRNDNNTYSVNLSPIISNLFTAGTGTNSAVLASSNSVASGKLSVAEGSGTTASGVYSHTEGYKTTASGEQSHAEGYSTQATGWSTHSEGESSQAFGYASHAEGGWSTSSGAYSHSEGFYSTSVADYSHAEGSLSTASGEYSHVEGYYNTSTTAGNYSSVGGQYNITSGNTAFIHSSGSTVMGNYSSILGGKGNIINPNVTGSTILGGSYITGDTSNVTYVPTLSIKQPFTPSSSGDTTGTVGQITYSTNYIYIKTSSGWGRAALDYSF